ncbi:hypothetical protein DFH07DRAFT_779712 [Mycena maculata]|uniref:JmjC domain-containing protein n=1 Tax=Mycena maculata TaxID=230809 RepID=A0AAD7I6R5_9AGAR|nr:hypothetical protein DFH07DRAFT_779712 [Mycena maculata]
MYVVVLGISDRSRVPGRPTTVQDRYDEYTRGKISYADLKPFIDDKWGHTNTLPRRRREYRRCENGHHQVIIWLGFFKLQRRILAGNIIPRRRSWRRCGIRGRGELVAIRETDLRFYTMDEYWIPKTWKRRARLDTSQAASARAASLDLSAALPEGGEVAHALRPYFLPCPSHTADSPQPNPPGPRDLPERGEGQQASKTTTTDSDSRASTLVTCLNNPMAAASALPEFVPCNLPKPRPPRRLSSAAAPWLHAGLHSGSLDVDSVAQDLARQVDASDEHVVVVLRHFFDNIVKFDITGCYSANSAMDTPQRALGAFQYLGIDDAMSIPPAPLRKLEQKWIISRFVPMAIADRLAWVAQPTQLAPPKAPRQATVNLMEREYCIAEWWHALGGAKKRLVDNPDAYKASVPTERLSTCAKLMTRVGRSQDEIVRCNLEAFVYALRAFLKGDPELTQETINVLVKEDATSDWTEDDIKKACADTNILSLCSPVVAACLFHSGGVVSGKTLIANRPLWPFVDNWLCRGNHHIVTDDRLIALVDRKFWVLALRAALGKIGAADILNIFFSDFEVVKVLDPEHPPGDEEQKCLDVRRIKEQQPTAVPVSHMQLQHLLKFENHFENQPLYDDWDGYEDQNVGFVLPNPYSLASVGVNPEHTHSGDGPKAPEPEEEASAAAEVRDAEEKELEKVDTEQVEESAPGSGRKRRGDSDNLMEDEEEVEKVDTEQVEESAPGSGRKRRGDSDDLMEDEEEVEKVDTEQVEESAPGSRRKRKGDSDNLMEDEDQVTANGEKEVEGDDAEPKTAKPPPNKKRKVETVPSSTRQLRARNPPPPPLAIPAPPAPSSSVSRPKAKLKANPASSTRKNSDGVRSEGNPSVQWLAVSEHYPVPEPPEYENLAGQPRLDPTILHALSAETLSIPYWQFKPSHDEDRDLMAVKHTYKFRTFSQTRRDLETLGKIVNSQPSTFCSSYAEDVPLHVHPYAQRFPLDADVTKKHSSIVHVASQHKWHKLTVREKQEILRTQCVLVIKDRPYQHDGERFAFNSEGLSAFTNLDRLAFVQGICSSAFSRILSDEVADLGARKADAGVQLKAGRPADLLYCAEQRCLRESSDGTLPPEGQVLNLLSNSLPNQTTATPPGWTQVHLATHETACRWLKGLPGLPEFSFPWGEVEWAILANKDAMTWIHVDVLFTEVSVACGEKLWFVGRLKEGVDSDRGNMRSRHAFDNFNGWTDMTDIWDFEMVHLDPYTTFYMPAAKPHCVLTMSDSIGVGKHGIPMSNASNTVFITLHNVVVSSITTNADHEPARRFLTRIFIFVALAFTNPHNTDPASVGAANTYPLPDGILQHLPDIETADGVLDVLALRSFVILFVALTSSAYPHMQGRALPVNSEVWQELSYAWTLALDLDGHIVKRYSFERSNESGPESFNEAADLTLLTMAASMAKYHANTKPDKSRPCGFTTSAFKGQLREMLGRFDLHRQKYDGVGEPSLGMNDTIGSADFAKLALVREFDQMLGVEDDYPLFLPWDKDTLGFKLVRVPVADF